MDMRTILKTEDGFNLRWVGARIASEYFAERNPARMGRCGPDPRIVFLTLIAITVVLMTAML